VKKSPVFINNYKQVKIT